MQRISRCRPPYSLISPSDCRNRKKSSTGATIFIMAMYSLSRPKRSPVEALRGNRLMLRGIGLNSKELEILGIAHAGE